LLYLIILLIAKTFELVLVKETQQINRRGYTANNGVVVIGYVDR